MRIARSYKFRLLLTPEQESHLRAWQQACMEAQNWCVTTRNAIDRAYKGLGVEVRKDLKDQPKETKRLYFQPSKYDLRVFITNLRDNVYDHWAIVPAHVMYSTSIYKLEEGWKKVVAARKTYYAEIQQGKRTYNPRTEPKLRQVRQAQDMGLFFPDSVTFVDDGRTGKVILGGTKTALGWLKFRLHRKIPQTALLRCASITLAADGWYISISCQVERTVEQSEGVSKSGVDLNVLHDGDEQKTVKVCDGREYRLTNHLKRNMRKVQRLGRLLSPSRKLKGAAKACDPASKRTARRKHKLALLHQRVSRQRAHVQRYIAKRLVDEADVVGFEDVTWSNLGRMKNGAKGRGFNRAMKTAAPGQQRKYTYEYAEKAGKTVVEVSARYTSQICSNCGQSGGKKDLKVRSWTCNTCGTTHDRDENAARNICERIDNRRCSFNGVRAGSDVSETIAVNCEEASASPGEITPESTKKITRSKGKGQSPRVSRSRQNGQNKDLPGVSDPMRLSHSETLDLL